MTIGVDLGLIWVDLESIWVDMGSIWVDMGSILVDLGSIWGRFIYPRRRKLSNILVDAEGEAVTGDFDMGDGPKHRSAIAIWQGTIVL